MYGIAKEGQSLREENVTASCKNTLRVLPTARACAPSFRVSYADALRRVALLCFERGKGEVRERRNEDARASFIFRKFRPRPSDSISTERR